MNKLSEKSTQEESGNKKCDGLRLLLRAPYPPPYGGIASLIVSLLPALRDYGAEDVVVLHYGKENGVKTVAGAKIYSFSLKSQIWRILLPHNWSTILTVLSTLKNSSQSFRGIVSDIIKAIIVNKIAVRHHSNVVSFYASNAAFELLSCRKKWGNSRGIILTIFGEVYENKESIMVRKPFFQSLLESPDAVLATSAHCGCSFQQIGINRAVDIIYVGVDLDRFIDDGSLRSQCRAQLGIAADSLVLLFMGRFHQDMGLDRLIASVPVLIKKSPNIKILFAGAKGPVCDMAFACAKRHPEHVKIINDVPFSLQPSLYAAADIVLAPSRDQRACMGVSIKEAMAAARPVIATKSGGIAEAVIDGETGILVPLDSCGDVDNKVMELAIQLLLNDKQRCLDMGKKARARAIELFSEQVAVQRMSDVFIKCMPSKTKANVCAE